MKYFVTFLSPFIDFKLRNTNTQNNQKPMIKKFFLALVGLFFLYIGGSIILFVIEKQSDLELEEGEFGITAKLENESFGTIWAITSDKSYGKNNPVITDTISSFFGKLKYKGKVDKPTKVVIYNLSSGKIFELYVDKGMTYIYGEAEKMDEWVTEGCEEEAVFRLYKSEKWKLGRNKRTYSTYKIELEDDYPALVDSLKTILDQTKYTVSDLENKMIQNFPSSLVRLDIFADSYENRFNQSLNYGMVLSELNAMQAHIRNNPRLKTTLDNISTKITSPPEKVIDICLMGQNKKLQRLSDHKGKLILLQFTTTDCTPCNRMNPKLKQVYSSLKGKNFQLFTVLMESENSTIDIYNFHYKISWPQVSLNDSCMRYDESVLFKYNPEANPSFFIISPEFKIVKKNQNINQVIDYLSEYYNAPIAPYVDKYAKKKEVTNDSAKAKQRIEDIDFSQVPVNFDSIAKVMIDQAKYELPDLGEESKKIFGKEQNLLK